MMAAPQRNSRREALPRRSAVIRPSEVSARPSAADNPMFSQGGGGFMGFQGIEEEEEVDEDAWFLSETDHTVLAGGYAGVRIFLTDKGFSSVRKWTDTEMCGVLRLIQVKEIDGLPCVML